MDNSIAAWFDKYFQFFMWHVLYVGEYVRRIRGKGEKRTGGPDWHWLGRGEGQETEPSGFWETTAHNPEEMGVKKKYELIVRLSIVIQTEGSLSERIQLQLQHCGLRVPEATHHALTPATSWRWCHQTQSCCGFVAYPAVRVATEIFTSRSTSLQ